MGKGKINFTNAAVVSGESRTHPTFVGPVGEPVHHVPLLLSVGEAQRFGARARHVVDISVEHKRLERTKDTRRASSLAAARRTSSNQELISGQHIYTSGSQFILFPSGCAAEENQRSRKGSEKMGGTGPEISQEGNQ